MKQRIYLFLSAFLFVLLGCKTTVNQQTESPEIVKEVFIDFSQTLQTIDGFGVNINPALWNDGKLKPVLDSLIDDLGCTQFRYDCWGNGDWLDTKNMNADGHFPDEYLKEVYNHTKFRDSWNMFRYINSKGIEPYFNISGNIPTEWKAADKKTLANFNAYAEMIATMLDWARNKEGLRFRYLAPFNETDYGGNQEGPGLPADIRIPAFRAVLQKCNEHGLNDLKYIVFCDGLFGIEKISPFLKDSSFKDKIVAISGHTYINGDEGDGDPWYFEKGREGQIVDYVKQTAYRDAHIWLNEYGDLDQSDEIEYEFSWRSHRRLMRALRDGVSSGQFWDAYDNYHVHDHAWSKFGLFKTDTLAWKFTPRHRYFVAKQIYRFVRPGFVRVEVKGKPLDSTDVYAFWRAPLKNTKILAFVSSDGSDFTVTGISLIEPKAIFKVILTSLPEKLKSKQLYFYRTSRTEKCEMIKTFKSVGDILEIEVPERSVFTLSTIK